MNRYLIIINNIFILLNLLMSRQVSSFGIIIFARINN